jgi:hypothetical protein
LVCCAISLLFVISGGELAVAQDEPMPVTWITRFEPLPGKGREVAELLQRYYGPVYDQLLADGTMMTWGLGAEIVVGTGPANGWLLWVTCEDWGKLTMIEDAIEAMQADLSVEERAERSEAVGSRFGADPGTTMVIRHVHLRPRGEGEVKYLIQSHHTAKPDEGEELVELFKEYVAPILEPLHADGSIVSYGMYVQEIHGHPGWSHVMWYMASDLAARDAVAAAFAAAEDERSETLGELIEDAFEDYVDYDAHYDSIIRVVATGAASD